MSILESSRSAPSVCRTSHSCRNLIARTQAPRVAPDGEGPQVVQEAGMAFAVRRGIRKPGRIHKSFFALEVVAGIRRTAVDSFFAIVVGFMVPY